MLALFLMYQRKCVIFIRFVIEFRDLTLKDAIMEPSIILFPFWFQYTFLHVVKQYRIRFPSRCVHFLFNGLLMMTKGHEIEFEYSEILLAA